LQKIVHDFPNSFIAQLAGDMTESVLLGLGCVALRWQLREDLTKTKLEWDVDKLAFTNHAAANQFIRREYRSGWDIKEVHSRSCSLTVSRILPTLWSKSSTIYELLGGDHFLRG
jgi:hypothetical protein